jgi:hypothetical protein
MTFEQFKPKNSNFWKWILWGGVSLFILVVGWSVNHMTPNLFPIALAMCIGGAAVSLVFTVYMTVNSPSLRRKAWACEGVIVVGLILNVIIHATLSRRFDVATQARQARYLEEERQLARQREADKSAMALMEKQAELAEKEAARLANQVKVTEAQNRQLRMIDKSKRRQVASGETSKPLIAPMPAATVEASPTPILPTSISDASTKADVSVLSPEQVQEQSWFWVLFGIFAEVGAIGGTFIYFGRGLVADTNRNGVPDWMEELPEEELLAKYPEHYRRLYGEPPELEPRPKQRPGYVSPTYAQAPGKDQPSR